MPIYDYQCTSCDHELETIQKISAAPLTDCPACQKPTLRKKVSAAAFRLSGSGWYETDFKKQDKQKNITKKETQPSKTTKTTTSTTKNKNSSSSTTTKKG